MKKYDVYVGIGSELKYYGSKLFENNDEALLFAYTTACNRYDARAGSEFKTISDIIEEENVTREKAEKIYAEERELWINYNVELAD